MKRHFLSKRETKEFKSLLDGFGIVVESKTLEIEENDHSTVYDGTVPILVKYQVCNGRFLTQCRSNSGNADDTTCS